MYRYFFISALAMAGGYMWGYADGMSFIYPANILGVVGQ